MANLTVGDFQFGLASFHLNEYTAEPVMDQTGLDLECTKITIDLHGVVNEVAIASNKAIAGIPGSPGDPLPTTMVALRDYLMRPRQYIKFTVGGVTVLESPSIKPPQVEMPCDVRGGPFPQRASFTQTVGDKSAIIQFRVVTYVSYCTKYLLSNRWSLSSMIGQDGMTTRTVSGRATFRKDFLDYDGLVADDFRKWLIVPCPVDMRRIHVTVNEAADGASVDYSVVDSQVRYGTGNLGILKVSGTVTGGCETEIKSSSQLATKVGETVTHFVKAGFKGPLGIPDIFKGISSLNAFIPSSKFSAVARVDGRIGANQYKMSQVAIAVCLDRLKFVYTPDGGIGFVSRAFVTNGLGSEEAPYSQAVVDVYGISMKILKQTFMFRPNELINTISTFDDKVTQAAGVEFSPNTPGARLPRSENTRGSQITRLMTQVLLSADDSCAVPAAPPVQSPSKDTGGLQ